MKYQIYFLASTTLKTDPLFSLIGTSKGYSVAARRSGYGRAKLRSDDCSVKISVLSLWIHKTRNSLRGKHLHLSYRKVINDVHYLEQKRKVDKESNLCLITTNVLLNAI